MKAKKEKRFKFIVGSAEEAIKVLRERLGDNAQVVSVRQVEGAGLARFLRAPKLEIIAQVGASEPSPLFEKQEPVMETPPVVEKSLSENPEPEGVLVRLLQRGGLTETMLARLKSAEKWPTLMRKPLRESLTEIAVWLRGEFQRVPKRPLAHSVVFIGSAGSGKTTALCKRLAMEVFLKQRRAVVLKLDMDKANPGDGLAVFCDVLGVPMVRSIGGVPELASDETLFIDLPGVALADRSEISEISNLLAAFSECSRVLVVNAAYEVGLIRQAYRMGSSLQATHAVFTHLDELTQWGKLWEFVLAREPAPLFFSTGQNIAGDFVESVFDEVLERSFRLVGKENATQRVTL